MVRGCSRIMEFMKDEHVKQAVHDAESALERERQEREVFN
jgi:hypothetical protein